jgi:hypothetical protein
MKKQSQKVLYDEDLGKFLSSVNQLAELEAGHLFCKECGVVITQSNLQLIVPISEVSYEYVCKSPQCVKNYYDQGGR